MKVETIEALLAKAESTTHEAEAAAFFAKAEALMLKHGIDEAMLARDKSRAAEAIVTHRLEFKGTYQKPLLLGAHLVAHGLSDAIHTHQVNGSSGRWLVLIGYDSDVARAIQLIASLQMQAIAQMEHWWKGFGREGALLNGATSREQLLHRRGYLIGYLREAANRLTALRTATVKASGSGAEVALYDRSQAITAFVAREYGQMKPGRGWAMDASGQRAGRADGAKADIGQTGVSRGSRALTN